jgi:uncharacterized RDD family membrane protein YckC
VVLDMLLYLLALLPFAIPAVVLIVGALDDCVWVDKDFGRNDELVCPPGAVDGASLAGGIVIGVIGVLVIWFVYIRALARTGQTWGRRLAGVKVVREEDGTPPGWAKAIGRTLFENFISSNLCYLGHLWMLWDSKKQTWHDKVSSTVVVKV